MYYYCYEDKTTIFCRLLKDSKMFSKNATSVTAVALRNKYDSKTEFIVHQLDTKNIFLFVVKTPNDRPTEHIFSVLNVLA